MPDHQKKYTLLFEYGAEGGSAKVFMLPDATVKEIGSSGGIDIDEFDTINKWQKNFDNWEAWWQHFTNKHQEFWIHFFPVYIHEDVKASILQALNDYAFENIDTPYHIEKWMMRLSKTDNHI